MRLLRLSQAVTRLRLRSREVSVMTVNAPQAERPGLPPEDQSGVRDATDAHRAESVATPTGNRRLDLPNWLSALPVS